MLEPRQSDTAIVSCDTFDAVCFPVVHDTVALFDVYAIVEHEKMPLTILHTVCRTFLFVERSDIARYCAGTHDVRGFVARIGLPIYIDSFFG